MHTVTVHRDIVKYLHMWEVRQTKQMDEKERMTAYINSVDVSALDRHLNTKMPMNQPILPCVRIKVDRLPFPMLINRAFMPASSLGNPKSTAATKFSYSLYQDESRLWFSGPAVPMSELTDNLTYFLREKKIVMIPQTPA